MDCSPLAGVSRPELPGFPQAFTMDNAAEVPNTLGKSLVACMTCRLVKAYDQARQTPIGRLSPQVSCSLDTGCSFCTTGARTVPS